MVKEVSYLNKYHFHSVGLLLGSIAIALGKEGQCTEVDSDMQKFVVAFLVTVSERESHCGLACRP